MRQPLELGDTMTATDHSHCTYCGARADRFVLVPDPANSLRYLCDEHYQVLCSAMSKVEAAGKTFADAVS